MKFMKLKYKFSYIIWAVFVLFFYQVYADNHSILKSVAEGNIERTNELLEQGMHPGAMDIQGFSLALISAGEGNIEMFNFLKEKGADIFVETDDGLNALHLSSANGHAKMSQHLIEEHGFNPSQPDKARGLTPLQWAVEGEHLLTSLVLLEGGADINNTDEYGWTAFHHASFLWKLAGVKFLRDRGTDISLENNSGFSAESLSSLSQPLYDVEYELPTRKIVDEEPKVKIPDMEEVKEVKFIDDQAPDPDTLDEESALEDPPLHDVIIIRHLN